MKQPRVAHRRLLLAALLLAGGSGCEDPLVDPAIVAGPRVLGARLSVRDGAELWAEPRAGETATLEWLVASAAPGTFAATLSLCVAEPKRLGRPVCAGPAFFETEIDGELGFGLATDFVVPGELAPGQSWLGWLGFCAASSDALVPARFDAARSEFVCDDGGAPLSAFYRGFIAAEGAARNANPRLADDRIELNGVEWLPEQSAAAPGSACLGTELPRLNVGSRASLALELGGDDRELLPEVGEQFAAGERENLVYTHVATRPGLERPFSAIDHDATTSRFELAFDVAAEPPVAPQGEAVVVHVVVRDERGGVDWASRALCVVAE